MLEKLKEWWRRPPAKQRIYAALSTTEWRSGFDLAREAHVWSGKFYPAVLELERECLVESKWEEGPPDPARGGYRRRLYRLNQASGRTL